MNYKLTTGNNVLRQADGACIPLDLRNRDYQDYLSWLALGNTPDPADMPNPNDAINAQINAIEQATLTNRGAREGWITLLLQQGAAIGKTQTDLLDPVTGNPFFRKLIEVDNQIRALRSQLT